MNDLLQAAATLGITVCVASGDDASADFAADDPDWDGHAHVDFPASSPFALACGGTRISADGASEVVWHPAPNVGSGGGVSNIFALPDYQRKAHVQQKRKNPAGPVRRGDPDVAGDAAQESGYFVICDGQTFPSAAGNPPIGGTSAVAPLWAGLVALLNEALNTRVGFLQPVLYPLAGTPAFTDIKTGNNGDYKAAKGWDPCTGLGVPNGQAILTALQGLAKPKVAIKGKSKKARKPAVVARRSRVRA